MGRDFRLLLGSSFASQIGDWASRLAIAVLVFERTGSPGAVGFSAALFVLPWLGLGQYLSASVDRFGARRTMMACDVLRALLFVAIAAGPPLPVIFGLVFCAATLDPVFEANRAALVFGVVTEDEYPSAIVSAQTFNQVAHVCGAGLGGLLVASIGVSFALLVNAGSFALSAMLVALIRSNPTGESAGTATDRLRTAVRFLRDDDVSRRALIGTLALASMGTGVESQVPVYVSDVFDGSTALVGPFAMLVPASMLVSIRVVPREGLDDEVLGRSARVAVVCALGSAVLLWLGSSLGVPGGLAAFALVGAGYVFVTFSNLVVGRRIPEDGRASVFAVLQASVFLATSSGALLVGGLAELVGVRVACGSAMAVAAAGVALAVFPGMLTRHEGK